MRIRLLALALVVPLAGCGAHKKQTFQDRADAICRDVATRVAAIAKPTAEAGLAAYTRRTLAVEQSGMARLRALAVPPARRSAFSAYRAALAQALTLQGQLASATETHAAGHAQAIFAQVGAVQLKAVTAAHQAGFSDCAK